ncbi:MAG: exo-alpha-sialidase [Gaiellaceae bacterium]
MKGLKRVATALALACVLLVVTAVAVAAAGQKQATKGDPYGACSKTPDIFGGTVFPSTEPEVWLTSNPADSQDLIGSIQQDRWWDGGAQGLVAPYSRDGGKAWQETPLPFSVCAGPYYHGNVLKDPFTGRPYDRASDPWVDVGPDGTAYAVSISFDANDNGGSVGAATSSDGGRSWHNQQNITAENANDPSFPFNDKESDTADPVHPGVAYAVWDRLQNIACPPGVPPGSYTTDERPFRFASALHAQSSAAALDCFDGPATFSRTTDFGHTWSAPVAIVPTPANEQTIANEIVVDPRTDTLYDFYMYIHADNSLTIEDVSSHDGGLTWGPRQIVSDSQTVGVTDPQTGDPLRTGDIIPQPAVDPATGRLYVVWQDARANAVDPDEDALFVSTSTGGGLTGTWSAPAVVNAPSDEAAFTPAIKVLGNGSVAVQYYVLRGKPGKGPKGPKGKPGVLTTGVVLRTTNGPGTTFKGPEQKVGDDFNMLAAPFSDGYFTGDYEGMSVDVRDPTTVHTFFTATNCMDTKCDAVAGFDSDGNPIPSNAPNPTDVFSSPVRTR